MSTHFDILDTSLQGLQVIQRKPIGDSRGYLERLFCRNDLAELLGNRTIVQINHTLTQKKGTVRGLHFQYPPHAETKFVMCLCGEVFDVAVDLRKDSPTFLHWHYEVLGETNRKTLMIPEGFAHGFQTLSDDCELIYFHTAAFCTEAEGGINALDPALAVQWPLSVTKRSIRDQQHPMITTAFQGISV